MKKLILVLLLLCCSCSTVLIYSPKTICNHGDHNIIEQTGSDLKDNQTSQESAPEVELPLP